MFTASSPTSLIKSYFISFNISLDFCVLILCYHNLPLTVLFSMLVFPELVIYYEEILLEW